MVTLQENVDFQGIRRKEKKRKNKKLYNGNFPIKCNGSQDGIGGLIGATKLKEEHQPTYIIAQYNLQEVSSSQIPEVDPCLESVEARLAHYKKNEAVFEESINVLKLEVRLRDNALKSQVSDKFKTGLGYNAATAASPAVESFVNSSEMLENQEYNRIEPKNVRREHDFTILQSLRIGILMMKAR
ncbi:hypothetical protein Tco_0344994 [Tanacetum coccineum]